MTNRIKGFFDRKKRGDGPHSRPKQPSVMVSMDIFMLNELRDIMDGHEDDMLEESDCDTVEEFIQESCEWEGSLNVSSLLVGHMRDAKTRKIISDIRVNTFQRYKIDPMQLQMIHMDPDFIEFCEQHADTIRSEYMYTAIKILQQATDVIVWRMFKPHPEALEAATLVYCCVAEQIQSRQEGHDTVITFGKLQSLITMSDQFVLLLKTGVLQVNGLFFEK